MPGGNRSGIRKTHRHTYIDDVTAFSMLQAYSIHAPIFALFPLFPFSHSSHASTLAFFESKDISRMQSFECCTGSTDNRRLRTEVFVCGFVY